MAHDKLNIGSTTEPIWSRGHGPKILEAVRSAHAAGRLPENPRPVEFGSIVQTELDARGYAPPHKPSRTALDERFHRIYRG